VVRLPIAAGALVGAAAGGLVSMALQITREMGITLERTGGTVTTTQQHDYNASLYRPGGEIMAAGERRGKMIEALPEALASVRKGQWLPSGAKLLVGGDKGERAPRLTPLGRCRPTADHTGSR